MQTLLYRGHVDYLALSPGIAKEIKNLPNELLIDSSAKVIRKHWGPDSIFIFVGAIGAVIRIIAPFLTTKSNDPAVLVIDSKAKNIIPLIGGHKAGADELALQLAEDLGGKPVITGFSATQEMLPLDSFGKAWGWERDGESKQWNDLMIHQARFLPISFIQEAGSKLWQSSKGASNSLSNKTKTQANKSLSFFIGSSLSKSCSWHPPVLWVGIGCERNSSFSLMQKALEESLLRAGLSRLSIAGLASIDIKSDEPALISLAKSQGFPIRFFSANDLSNVVVPNPSSSVQAEVGTASVAEAASLLSAGKEANLKLEKQVFQSDGDGAVTISIAESVKSFAPDRGELHLVGSGPGALSLLTQDARFALSRSAVWIGYKRYLELLEPLRRHDQVRVDSQITSEKDRCEKALALSVQGARVSLLSSGDSGIYGMAGLALELWLNLPKQERPLFQVHPGISAFQIAAAKTGAPLMHDFCAISLSDCLTPWSKIEERLKAAANGDFVVAIYNPRSKDRDWQLGRAIEILLEHRSIDTPVLIARQIGRSEEEISRFNLGTVPIEKVDMLSFLLIGNSTTYEKDGYLLTPRGY